MPEKVKGTATKREKEGSITSTTYMFSHLEKPPEKSLREIIYDDETGQILGRTCKNWGAVTLFYIIFFSCIAALFAVCMKLWFMGFDLKTPKFLLDESLIGSNPGLGFRPLPRDPDHGSLIWYDIGSRKEIRYWTEILDEYFDGYHHPTNNQRICDFDSTPRPGKVCKIDIDHFEKCAKSNAYGYNNSSPCIFLKLNRIYGWIPEYYNDPFDLPADMPQDLRQHIQSLPEIELHQIWVSCRGEQAGDKEIVGDIEYYPSRGFPAYFYPYMNDPGYLSPLVAVRFVRPMPNQIINIECRTWAKNIKYDGSFRDRKGSVHLELMIDAY